MKEFLSFGSSNSILTCIIMEQLKGKRGYIRYGKQGKEPCSTVEFYIPVVTSFVNLLWTLISSLWHSCLLPRCPQVLQPTVCSGPQDLSICFPGNLIEHNWLHLLTGLARLDHVKWQIPSIISQWPWLQTFLRDSAQNSENLTWLGHPL